LTADPHFHTRDNSFYDYDGQCDLLLIKDDVKGINLHIRTEPQGGYASISHTVLEIGGDTVEINPTGVLLNLNPPPSPLMFVGGYPSTHSYHYHHHLGVHYESISGVY
jgi:hypothetical protein